MSGNSNPSSFLLASSFCRQIDELGDLIIRLGLKPPDGAALHDAEFACENLGGNLNAEGVGRKL
jgi:hypothetical protein